MEASRSSGRPSTEADYHVQISPPAQCFGTSSTNHAAMYNSPCRPTSLTSRRTWISDCELCSDCVSSFCGLTKPSQSDKTLCTTALPLTHSPHTPEDTPWHKHPPHQPCMDYTSLRAVRHRPWHYLSRCVSTGSEQGNPVGSPGRGARLHHWRRCILKHKIETCNQL